MWPRFDGKPYSREALATHIDGLDFSRWRRKDGTASRPKYIVLHNTSVPTIKQWLAWSPDKRQQYIKNMEPYYAGMGWRGGPHYFVPPQEDICAFGFNDPTTCGTHASCFNSDSIGIETVGEFNVESPTSGPGLIGIENAIHLMALLHRKLGLTPEPYAYGRYGLHFHVECRADDHDCPGKLVHKPDIVARVAKAMAAMDPEESAPHAPVPTATDPAPVPAQAFTKITATEFGGHTDRETSAYDGHLIGDNELGVALPFHFPGTRPKIRVFHGDKSAVAEIIDVGPWFPSFRGPADPYWLTGARPRAETYKGANGAGIDLTPGLWASLGVPGPMGGRKGLVDWQFEPAG